MDINKTLALRIDLICLRVTSHMFAVFVNPANRGPNFTWQEFPEIIKDLVTSHVFDGIGRKFPNEELQVYISERIAYFARDLMTAANMT